MPQLSVIILSYNTKDITKQCLDALIKSLNVSKLESEIIVLDNASEDSSVEMLKKYESTKTYPKPKLVFIYNKKNVGYPKGNNQGIKIAKGKYILLLNSDALIQNIDWQTLLKYLDNNPQVGVLTVKVNLPIGRIDPASHRGFPTIWNSFCYFSGLEKILGRIPLIGKYFGGYHLTHLDLQKIHEIDSPAGAFYFSPRVVLNKVKGFDDKNFFLYGEDLDLSYRIKELGYEVIYYPFYTTLHLKHASGLKKKNTKIRSKSREYFYESMKIFYRKHYERTHPWFINKLVYFAIDLKKKFS